MFKKVSFTSDGNSLEGNLDSAPDDKGVVITHPHPLYGGDMHSNVVETIHRVYRKAGYTTLRFNFRGVGGSGGTYDEGTGETQDVQSAVNYLRKSGKTNIHLAGYSFGSWVNSMVDARINQISRMTMVSPPVAFIDFKTIKIDCPLRVITGSRDDYAPPALVKPELMKWNPDWVLKVIDNADHFYGGYIRELESILEGFLEE